MQAIFDASASQPDMPSPRLPTSLYIALKDARRVPRPCQLRRPVPNISMVFKPAPRIPRLRHPRPLIATRPRKLVRAIRRQLLPRPPATPRASQLDGPVRAVSRRAEGGVCRGGIGRWEGSAASHVSQYLPRPSDRTGERDGRTYEAHRELITTLPVSPSGHASVSGLLTMLPPQAKPVQERALGATISRIVSYGGEEGVSGRATRKSGLLEEEGVSCW
jgi:hypothetical protein